MTFLGYEVSKDDVQVAPRKIEAIIEWPRPKTIAERLNFLGLADYYRRFMKDFSKITVPLAKLTQRNIRFNWTDKCEEPFQLLKDLLTSAPVLALPSGDEGYTVYCDASRVGLE